MSPADIVHVAVAVIYDSHRNILITKRPAAAHQGGLWEFPGGKIEPGEDIETALKREILEELGIQVLDSRPLISIPFDYGDKLVHLHVRQVNAFNGEAHGREGQAMQWMALRQSHQYKFPAANHAILCALQLPSCYHITPEPDPDMQKYLAQLELVLENHAELIQFRSKRLSQGDFERYAVETIRLCRDNDAKVILNSDVATALELDADGVHLTSAKLWQCERRPIAKNYLFAVSCHNQAELDKAQSIAADFAVLGPVLATATHPNTELLGWDVVCGMLMQVRIPVFALGGLDHSHLIVAQESGAQGIAAIRSLWIET
jgi:8-oxo-dGTP diphosphatase